MQVQYISTSKKAMPEAFKTFNRIRDEMLKEKGYKTVKEMTDAMGVKAYQEMLEACGKRYQAAKKDAKKQAAKLAKMAGQFGHDVLPKHLSVASDGQVAGRWQALTRNFKVLAHQIDELGGNLPHDQVFLDVLASKEGSRALVRLETVVDEIDDLLTYVLNDPDFRASVSR